MLEADYNFSVLSGAKSFGENHQEVPQDSMKGKEFIDVIPVNTIKTLQTFMDPT